MKSYKGLFDAMMNVDLIEECAIESSKGKRRRKDVIEALSCPRETAIKVYGELLSGNWHPPKHCRVTINDRGSKKKRQITKPDWRCEQIVHHVVMTQFKPIVMARLDKNVYGSIPGRGPHGAAKTMRNWVDNYNGMKFYVAELDVRKFYDMVDHEILKDLLSNRIRDKRYLEILFRIVDNYTSDDKPDSGVGLPLGNYTSPWLANFYLIGLDNFILQEMKPDHYLRYMDNLFLFSRNKRKLHRMVDGIREWVVRERKLEIKDNWQVYRFEDSKNPDHGRAINALGFVIHRDRTTLRKTILHGIVTTARRIHEKGLIGEHDAMSMVSRMGYADHCDTHRESEYV